MILLMSSACSPIKREIFVHDETGRPVKGALAISELRPTGFMNISSLPIGTTLSVTDDHGRAMVSGSTSILAPGFHPVIQEGYGGFERLFPPVKSFRNSINSLESAVHPPSPPWADGAAFSLFSREKYSSGSRTSPLTQGPFVTIVGHKSATGDNLATYRFLACPSASLNIVFHFDQEPSSDPKSMMRARRRSFEVTSSLSNLQESKRFFFEKPAKSGWGDKILNTPHFFCRKSNNEVYKIMITGVTIEGMVTCPNSDGTQLPCITISEVSRRLSDSEEAFQPVPPPANLITEFLTQEWKERRTVELYSPKEEVARALKLHLLDLGAEASEIDRVIRMLAAA
jgi:hypothetical protein